LLVTQRLNCFDAYHSTNQFALPQPNSLLTTL